MTNTTWFVTGASRGLGLVLVQKLLAEGHRVAATSRSRDELVRAVGAPSDRWLPIALDVTDEADCRRAIEATIDRFGAIDALVNNAGYGQLGAVEELTDGEARRNFDVNVFGVLHLLRAALPHLRRRGKGHIFNVGSIGGFDGGFAGWGVYCATKFALSGLTEGLHAELAPFGIHVTLVYPGYFRTDFLSSGSVGRPSRPLPMYRAARESERQHVDVIHGNQPGDPAKLAAALLATQAMSTPPLHLFLGSDAVSLAEKKLEGVAKAIDTHRALSVGTDFAAR